MNEREIETVRDYQQVLDISVKLENVDLDEQYISNDDRKEIERIVEKALSKYRLTLGL